MENEAVKVCLPKSKGLLSRLECCTARNATSGPAKVPFLGWLSRTRDTKELLADVYDIGRISAVHEHSSEMRASMLYAKTGEQSGRPPPTRQVALQVRCLARTATLGTPLEVRQEVLDGFGVGRE